ncbi:MAG: DUF3365 domain-containing protein [Verrucomicrobiae bacterium]|nr:DUF3365 domain-containing protein [Verrucomicrobiae bacterium]
MSMPSWLGTGLGLALVFGACSKPPEPPAAAPPPPLPEVSAEERADVLARGRAIAGETFEVLRGNLQTAIQAGGIRNALPFCSMAASPLTAGMATKHGVTLRRVTHKTRNPAGAATPAELAILETFRQALRGPGITPTNPPPPMVTNFDARTLSFFAPIVMAHELCLKCHGEPGRDILPEDYDIILRLYPQDRATGFEMGQLRGAWRIDFPRALSDRPAE